MKNITELGIFEFTQNTNVSVTQKNLRKFNLRAKLSTNIKSNKKNKIYLLKNKFRKKKIISYN